MLFVCSLYPRLVYVRGTYACICVVRVHVRVYVSYVHALARACMRVCVCVCMCVCVGRGVREYVRMLYIRMDGWMGVSVFYECVLRGRQSAYRFEKQVPACRVPRGRLDSKPTHGGSRTMGARGCFSLFHSLSVSLSPCHDVSPPSMRPRCFLSSLLVRFLSFSLSLSLSPFLPFSLSPAVSA